MIAESELTVWRGHGWRDTAISLTVIGLLFLALPGTLLILVERSAWGIGLLAAGFGVAWLRSPFSRWGQERLRLRYDREGGVLWTERSKRRGDPVRISNADRITDFALARETAAVGRQRAWALRPRDPGSRVAPDHLRFASKRQAKRARKALRTLLGVR